ncbi:MAG: EAL domain-containing protein [Patescibacteria group bacterium]
MVELPSFQTLYRQLRLKRFIPYSLAFFNVLVLVFVFIIHQVHYLLLGVLIFEGFVVTALLVARVWANQQLAESELRHRLVVRATHDVVWDWDVIANRTTWSNGIKSLFGYKPEDAQSTSWWEQRLHPEDREHTLTSLAKSVEHEKDWRCEYRFRRSDGVYINVIDRGFVVDFEDGKTKRMIGAMLDVTKQRQTQFALKQSEEHFRTLVNSVQDAALFMIDEKGAIMSWNNGAERVYGYEEQEVLKKNVSLFFLPEDIEKREPQKIQAVAAKSGFYQVEGWRRRKDNSLFWASVMLTSFRDENAVLRGFVVSVRDRTERKTSEDTIKFQAFHDALTGLPNRTRAESYLTTVMHSRRKKTRFALFFIDLDKFKKINDTLGHAMGDRILKEVAVRFRDAVRHEDLVARFAGDEFLVISLVDTVDDARKIADDIFHALLPDFIIDSYHLQVTASMGIVLYPDHGTSHEILLKNADAALYRAKENGRNQYQFFGEHMVHEALERISLESSLRQAIKKNEFQLYYQPVVDSSSQGIVGAEALIRWNHPERGLLYPSEFISLAEDTGSIIVLGGWVLQEACMQLQRWHQLGFTHLSMGINVSPRQMIRSNIVEQVREVLDKTRLDPSKVNLEVTENIALQNNETLMATIRQLRGLGVGLVLDDFGLGHSSLGYLKQFSITGLKVDQSFVRKSLAMEEDAAIVKAIVLLSQTLNLSLVAEGVETEEEKAFLQANGCRYLQGYLFSKPLPAEEFEKLLHQQQVAITYHA